MMKRLVGSRLLGARALSSTPSKSIFHGVFPIMATPFNPDESLDLDGFRRSIAFMQEAGADGATIVGVLGESNRMTDKEREALIRAAIETAADGGRPFPICVGTSHAGTAATVALSQMAMDLGAAAVMVTPSKEAVPPSDDAFVALYSRVAEGCPGLAIVLQDHPASTQVSMTPRLVARIAAEVPAVACIKLESLPTPGRIATLRQLWRGLASPSTDACFQPAALHGPLPLASVICVPLLPGQPNSPRAETAPSSRASVLCTAGSIWSRAPRAS